jgi:cyclase
MKEKMHAGAIKPLYQMARELRNKATHAETILWEYLRTKPYGYKFRRQHPYSIYILDFYCHALKLVIEVDGNIHLLPKVKQNDIVRQQELEQDGLIVMRFENSQIAKKSEQVFSKIEEFIINQKNETKRK